MLNANKKYIDIIFGPYSDQWFQREIVHSTPLAPTPKAPRAYGSWGLDATSMHLNLESTNKGVLFSRLEISGVLNSRAVKKVY